MIAKLQKLARQFIVFCGVGAINTGVSLFVILVLSQWVGLHYMLSNFCGYIIGLFLGFTLHFKVTFKAKRHNSNKRVWEYLKSFSAIFFIAYLIQLLLLYVMVKVIVIDDALAQVIAVGSYTVISFAGNRFWTFK